MNSKIFVNFISTIIIIFIMCIIVIDLIFDLSLTIESLYWICLAEVVFAYIFLATHKNYRFGFHFIILTYMILCQFGFVFANEWNSEAAIIRSAYSMRFVDMPEYLTAIELSIVFVGGFVLSTFLPRPKFRLRSKDNLHVGTKRDQGYDYNFQRAVYYVGLTTLILGCGLLAIAWYITRGIAYSESVDILGTIWWYGHLTIILSFAFTMIIAICDTQYWHRALIPYACVCLLHLMMGNRGEIFYCIATCIGIYLLRYKKIKIKWIIFGALGFALLIPMVRVFRESLSFQDYSASILDNVIETFSELGFQIAPFTYTIDAIESGTSFRLGGTYLYGIFDFIGRKIPFVGGMPYNSLDNIKYMLPQQGLGYSQVAEAYYNFGSICGTIFMFLLGWLVLKFEDTYVDSSENKYKRLFVSLFIVELVNLTRNSSGTLMVYTTYIGLLMIAVYILEKTTTHRNNRHNQL